MQFSITVDVFFLFIDTLVAGGLKTTSEFRDDDSSITSSSSVELSSAKLIVSSGSGS